MESTTLSRTELRRLFELRQTPSDTHDTLPCKRCPKPAPPPAEAGAEGAEEAAGPPAQCSKGKGAEQTRPAPRTHRPLALPLPAAAGGCLPRAPALFAHDIGSWCLRESAR